MRDQAMTAADPTRNPARATAPERVPFWRKRRDLLLLLAILLIAAIFRFTGSNFDSGTSQHPDERFIVGRTLTLGWPESWEQFTNIELSPLNLRNLANNHDYIYGSLPVYMGRATGWLLDNVLPPTDARPKGYYLRDYPGIAQAGRHLAAVFDLITIVLVFLIGRRLFSSGAGLVAAALVAFAVTHIQIAHFYASDTFLVTFMMTALYFSVRLMQRPSLWNALGAGVFVGLAVASKVSIAPFALIVVAAVALRAFYRKRTRILAAEFGEPVGLKPATKAERERPLWAHLLGGVGYIALAGVAAFLAFAITEPYVLWTFNWSLMESGGLKAVFDSNPWWTRLMAEAQTQSGQGDPPFTRQYVGTVPLLYHLEQMVVWGLSPIPGVVVVAGFVAGLWRAIQRRPAEILLMSGAIPYFATILTLEAKWMRYMLPLVPIFCLLGAAMLVRGIEWQKARWPAAIERGRKGFRFLTVQRNLFRIFTGVTIGAAFLWAVAFMNIYSEEHSRIQASRWIHQNVPDGSKTSSEAWDDRLPLGLQGIANRNYTEIQYQLYDDRPPEGAFDYISRQLATTDYIFLASNRLYDSMDNLPWRYPVVNRYYDLLFEEKLGFVKVHTSQVTPELLGIRFNDQAADESFTVYDHPRVDVFKKVSALTEEQLRSLFSPALNRPPGEYSAARHDKAITDKTLLYEQPIAKQPDLGDYAWNPLAQEDTQWIGVLLWLIAAQLLGLLALPIIFTVFRNLPDRGYAFAKLGGLLLVTWGVWLLSSARLIPFTVWSIVLMIGLLGLLSALCWRLGAGQAIRDFYRERRSLVIFYETLFFVMFAGFLFIRMLNPDLWHPYNGGEKPMEFGFLNATLRSPWMPPADPFFSGGYINYYYHGMFIVGTLIKLIGVDPAIGFNLAIPLLYALTFTAGASVVYNVVAWSQRRRGSQNRVSRSGMAFGVLGGVLMLAIGNMAAFWQAFQIALPDVARTVLGWARDIGFGSVTTLRTVPSGEGFDFWGPSRVIPETINEFPLWSFLFADLHPHLINMPFTVMAFGLGVNLAFVGAANLARFKVIEGSGWLTSARQRVGASLGWLWGNGWAGALAFAFTALTLGLLAVTNSWDFPTYMGLTGGAILIAVLRLRSGAAVDTYQVPSTEYPLPSDETRQAGSYQDDTHSVLGTRYSVLSAASRWTLYVTSALSVGVLAGVSLLAYIPFFIHFKAFFTQILPIVEGTLVGNAVMRRTTIYEFLVIWLIFVAVAGAYLLARLVAYPWQNVWLELRSYLNFGPKPKVPATNSAAPQHASTQQAAQPFALRRPRAFALATEGSGIPTSGGTTFAFRMGETVADEGQTGDGTRGGERWTTNGQNDEIGEVDGVASTDGDATNGLEETERPEPSPARGGWVTGYAPLDELPIETNGELATRLPHIEDATLRYPVGPAVDEWSGGKGDAIEPLASGWQEGVEREERVVVAAPPQVGIVPAWMGAALLALTAGLVVLQIATGQMLLALLIGLLGGILATTLGGTRSAAAHITGLLFVGALAVALGVELVYLADHLQGGSSYRMNTVFKFYIQVWVLFAMASAAGLYFTMYGIRDRFAQRPADRGEQQAFKQETSVELDGTANSSDEARPIATNGAAMSTPDDDILTTRLLTSNWLAWTDTEPLTPQMVSATEPSQGGDPHDDGPRAAQPTQSDSQTKVQNPKSKIQNPKPIWSPARVAWVLMFGLLLLASLNYTIYGTPARIKDRFSPAPPLGTLDGLKFMTTSTFDPGAAVAPFPINMKYDYQAIEWLNKNVSGLHVIAERPLGYYREYGMRIASNTGLPMVVGGLHQGEQRYDWMVGDRHGDMHSFYTTPDIQTALNIINKHDIEYIYVGQLEQGYRDDTRITFEGAKFEQMTEAGILRQVFHADAPEGLPDTSIYQVVRDAGTIAGAPVEGSGIPGISITPVPTRSPTPMPTPPSDDVQLRGLLDAVAANPTDRGKRGELIEWYRSHGFPLDAARELETLVQQDPNDIAVRHQLGDAYMSAGQPERAIKAWEDARDVDPNNPAAHNKVGIAYLERNRYDDAMGEFRAAVERDPKFVESWFHLGRAYEAKGEREEAKRAYQSVLQNSSEENSWAQEAQKRLNELP